MQMSVHPSEECASLSGYEFDETCETRNQASTTMPLCRIRSTIFARLMDPVVPPTTILLTFPPVHGAVGCAH